MDSVAGSRTTPDAGVGFPTVAESTRRSSSSLGRAVVADALAAVDAAAARAALTERDWRRGYPRHFRALLEAGATDSGRALRIATAGLASLHHRMQWCDPDSGAQIPLVDRPTQAQGRLERLTLHGNGAPQPLSLPYAGGRLIGDDLRAQLDLWVHAGVMEPDAADAVRRVMANPQWLSLPGRTAVVLGAGAEMGPLRSLLRWGADVAAVDVPQPAMWRRLLADVRPHAGTLTVPVADEGSSVDAADHVGVDLVRRLPQVHDWIGQLAGDLVLGGYAYADGAAHVRVAAAVDDLAYRLLRQGERQVALAFLATPTDVFAVPEQARRAAQQAYARGDVDEGAGLLGRLGPAVRSLSRGRLLVPQYEDAPRAGMPSINDSIVVQQGPNYLLAKRIQRWRAYEARSRGHLVSFGIAPPTRTRSVMHNPALAAVYAGAHRFGVEVFAPATSSTLMAVLLVHDLYAGGPTPATPWQIEARHAVHGGLWRTPFEPRSALALAAVAGVATRR